MGNQLDELRLNALRELRGINNPQQLESWRVRFLGKKSQLVSVLRSLSRLPLEERKAVGAHANQTKSQLEESLHQKEQTLQDAQLAESAGRETIDITLPGRPVLMGGLHPITQTIYEMLDIFV